MQKKVCEVCRRPYESEDHLCRKAMLASDGGPAFPVSADVAGPEYRETVTYLQGPERQQQQQPVEGEEIMVSTPYDVFILPLRTSGLDGNGPRFVVHVPGPEQPAPQAQSSTEAWRDLAIASAAIVEEIREIVGLKGKYGDVVEAVRKLAAG